MPSFFALSARLSRMPVPGKAMTVNRQHLKHRVVALERRRLVCALPVWPEGNLRHLAAIGPLGGDKLYALGGSPVQQHHCGASNPFPYIFNVGDAAIVLGVAILILDQTVVVFTLSIASSMMVAAILTGAGERVAVLSEGASHPVNHCAHADRAAQVAVDDD
jgi:hypothetical protein